MLFLFSAKYAKIRTPRKKGITVYIFWVSYQRVVSILSWRSISTFGALHQTFFIFIIRFLLHIWLFLNVQISYPTCVTDVIRKKLLSYYVHLHKKVFSPNPGWPDIPPKGKFQGQEFFFQSYYIIIDRCICLKQNYIRIWK